MSKSPGLEWLRSWTYVPQRICVYKTISSFGRSSCFRREAGITAPYNKREPNCIQKSSIHFVPASTQIYVLYYSMLVRNSISHGAALEYYRLIGPSCPTIRH